MTFDGVPLDTLLEAAGPLHGTAYVMARSHNGGGATVSDNPFADLVRPDASICRVLSAMSRPATTLAAATIGAEGSGGDGSDPDPGGGEAPRAETTTAASTAVRYL